MRSSSHTRSPDLLISTVCPWLNRTAKQSTIEPPRDTPISENSFTGLGVGAALVGARPVVEIMTINFMLLALDSIINGAAKIPFMSGGFGADAARFLATLEELLKDPEKLFAEETKR